MFRADAPERFLKGFVQQDLKRPASEGRTTPLVNFPAGRRVTEPRKRNVGASMPEWADENLAALVRRVIPPRHPDWTVQVVDNPEEACAIFARDLVRVQRHWRETVYETGLHSVSGRGLAMHYTLGLVKARGGAHNGLEIWKARAIRRANGGLFDVNGYLSRVIVGRGVAFDGSRKNAERLALEGAGRLPRRALPSRAGIRRRQKLLNELASRTRYEGGFRVSAAAYERWFPDRSVAVFRHFKNEGVPLVQVVEEARDGLPALQDYEFKDFLCRLSREMAEAEPVARQPRLPPSYSFAPEDDAIMALGFEGL